MMEQEVGAEGEYNTCGVSFGTGEIFSASSMVNAALRPDGAMDGGLSRRASLGASLGHLQPQSLGLTSPGIVPMHRRSHSDPVFLGTAVRDHTIAHDSSFNPSHMGTAVVGFQSVAAHTLKPAPSGIFAAVDGKVKLENDDNGCLQLEHSDSIPAPRNTLNNPAGSHCMPGSGRLDLSRDVAFRAEKERLEGALRSEKERFEGAVRSERHEFGASAMSSPTEFTGGFCSRPTSTASRNAAPVLSKTDNDEAAESDSQPASSEKISLSNGQKNQLSRKRGGFNGRTNEELQQLDPKRVRRILANRESAARSKERKLRYTNDLDSRLKTLTTTCERLTSSLNSLRQGHLELYEQAQQYQTEMEQLEGYLDHIRTINKDYTKRLTALQSRIGKQNAQQRASRSRVDSSRNQFVSPEQVITPVKEFPDWYPNAGNSWNNNKYSTPPAPVQVNYRSPEPQLPNICSYDAPIQHDVLHRADSAIRHEAPPRQHSGSAPPPGDGHNTGPSYLNSADLYDNYDSWSYGDNRLMPEWDYRPDSTSTLHASSPTALSLLDDHVDEHSGDWPDCKIDIPLSIVDDIAADCGGLSKPVGGSGLFPGLQFA